MRGPVRRPGRRKSKLIQGGGELSSDDYDDEGENTCWPNHNTNFTFTAFTRATMTCRCHVPVDLVSIRTTGMQAKTLTLACVVSCRSQ